MPHKAEGRFKNCSGELQPTGKFEIRGENTLVKDPVTDNYQPVPTGRGRKFPILKCGSCGGLFYGPAEEIPIR